MIIKLREIVWYMTNKERIFEIQPNAYSKVRDKISEIWEVIYSLSDDSHSVDIQSTIDELEVLEYWCGLYIGYGRVGAFCSLEIIDRCRSRVEEAIKISAFRSEFCYELELLGFVICAYFGMDYREICRSINVITSFEYYPCMICEGFLKSVVLKKA